MIPVSVQLVCGPYLVGAWLNSKWWTRCDPAKVEIADRVFLGKLPTQSISYAAQRVSSVVDLSAELSVKCNGIQYRNVPVLDLTIPTACQLDQAVGYIEMFRFHRPTLVSCALGYSRSAAAVVAWLIATDRAASVEDAIAIIRGSGKRIVLSGAHIERIEHWAKERRCA